MRAGFEFFDHTADMGIRVCAADLPALLQPAAEGLYAAIGELVAGAPVTPVSLDLGGHDAAELLRDFLTELLILFERDQRMMTTIDCRQFDDQRLIAVAQMNQIDPETSVFDREVEAVTYHELAIRTITGGVEATFIVDI